MRLHILIGIGITVLAGSLTRAVDQQSQQQALNQLGPEPSWVTPKNLQDLLNTSQAAVIAEIVGPGELNIEEISTPGTWLGPAAYASYRVIVRDVLYNRGADAPPLPAAGLADFTQRVGRNEAEAFVARRVPVVAHEECLLFLWHRPGAPEWSILQWPLQFRKSDQAPGFAEPIGKPTEVRWLDAAWFGPSVPVTTAAGRVLPMWPQLIDQVKRLGSQSIKQ